ncbi:MAG TPA: hypothetical protein VFL82_01910 [Thermomicrobiales bacterium]|nr:hypothetical protein [Thermomicrobiales bacterium]
MDSDKNSRESPVVTMIVTPEPTDDERDALTAALMIALSTAPAVRDAAPRSFSRWALAGRRTAIGHRIPMGWGRGDERTR